MTAVISGTNGLLQSYGYIDNTTSPVAATNGFNYTFAAGTQVLVINPAGTLATGTITMPASPVDGMTITFSSSQQITALTMAGNGASLVGAVTFLPAKTGVTYVYRATGTTWYPTATVPGTGSQLVSGTLTATTSGTSVDFTGIPSWVKRVTVMLKGVSTSGTSALLFQLGTSGGVQATGYTANSGANTYTTGFGAAVLSVAADAGTGVVTFTLLDSATGTWSWGGTIGRDTTFTVMGCIGYKALSGTLDRVRLTTVAGTDTFDAGSINILYE